MPILKHRHIRFRRAPQTGGIVELEEKLKTLKGVSLVRIETDKKEVVVEYDLLECFSENIEDVMVESGFVLSKGLIQRFKRGWIHYTEVNEFDSLKAKPHSCCDIEGVEAKRSGKKREEK